MIFPKNVIDETTGLLAMPETPKSEGVDSLNVIGSVIVNNNSTATVISTIDTFTDLNLNALAFEGDANTQFTLTSTTTGESRYDGLETRRFSINGGLSAFSSGGGAQEFHFRVVVNGSVTPDAAEIAVSLSGDVGAVPLPFSFILAPTDLVRLQVENTDGTTNVTVSQLSMEIR